MTPQEKDSVMFDPEVFRTYLRTAAVALDAAVDMLEEAIVDPTVMDPMYLLGRLNIAQEIVELELPEFQRAAMATVAEMFQQAAE